MVEHRIQRGGLARAGRSGHQDDAFRARHHQPQLVKLSGRQVELVQRHDALEPVQYAQHQVFAMHGGLGGHPEIDGAAAEEQRNAPVLRCACFRDVHAAHDLQAYHHGRPVGLVQRTDLAQHAVNAVSDADEAFFRLKVQVGGFALYGISQQGIDQPDHRLAVFALSQRQAGGIHFAGFDLAQDAVNRQLVAVILVNGPVDVAFAGQHRHDVAQAVAGLQADLVQCHDVVRIGHGQGQLARRVIPCQRKQGVALGLLARHVSEGGLVHHQS